MSIKAMNWVWQDVRVEGGLKLILLAMADHADDNGVAWPSLQTIADKAEVSFSTAKRKVKQLETLGIIQVARRASGYNNSVNRYRLNLNQRFDFRSVVVLDNPAKENTGFKLTPVDSGAGQSSTGVNLNSVENGSGLRLNPLSKCTEVNLTPVQAATEFSQVTPVTRVNLTPVSDVTGVTIGEPSLGSPRVSREPSRTTNTNTTTGATADPFKQTPARKIERFAMFAEWIPSDQVFERIKHRRIDTAFAKNLIDGFRIYWSERGEQHASGWNAKFLSHVLHNWETGGRERHQAQQTAGKSLEDKLTDRSWADVSSQ